MKQRITEKQLNELSEEGKEKLREWWKPTLADRIWDNSNGECIYYNDDEYEFTREKEHKHPEYRGDGDDIWQKCYPLLSIGQMIEFLDEYKHFEDNCILKQNKKWSVFTEWDDGAYHAWGKSRLNLCDALWEATKGVLENKKI